MLKIKPLEICHRGLTLAAWLAKLQSEALKGGFKCLAIGINLEHAIHFRLLKNHLYLIGKTT